MNLSRNIGVIFLILSFNPFVLCQVTDSHDGDFVVVTGTTTYESLPFIETFSDESGQLNNGQRLFNTWVTAKWNGTNSTSDDYNPRHQSNKEPEKIGKSLIGATMEHSIDI